MNKEWSEINKTVQAQIKKENTFVDGIAALLALRQQLFDEMHRFKKELSREEFNAIPFINATGYHSKTIAYSLWHIFRIEDIVAHTLIQGEEQIFFAENFAKRIGSPIITTGNELVKQEIADFSKTLDLTALYQYAGSVKDSVNAILKKLSFADLRRKTTAEDKKRLCKLEVVSIDEKAFWLVDYWCGKDIRGLVQMPFSRHWLMHVEACLRIKNTLRPG